MVRDGYKITEIGVIPFDWEVLSLGKSLSDNPDYGINAAAVPKKGRLPTYLRITDIDDDGRINVEGLKSVDHENSSDYLLQNNEIVLARTGASVGKSYIHNKEKYGEVVFAGFLIRVKPSSEVDPHFIYQQFQTKHFWKWIEINSVRSGQPGINGRQYSELKIPLPPTRTEQTAIATALSDADALLSALDGLVSKKEAFKRGMMEGLLSGEIRLEGFLGAWEETTIGDCCTVEMGQSPSSIYYNESGLGLPLVQGNADIKNRKSIVRNYSSVSPKTCSVEDILISVRAPVGEIAIASYESCLGRGVAALKAIQCPDFIYQLMIYNEGEWAKFSKGSTFDSITSEQVRDFKLSLPPLPEQVAIATLLSDLDAELSALRARREKLGLVKGGMMEVLLSGGVRLV